MQISVLENIMNQLRQLEILPAKITLENALLDMAQLIIKGSFRMKDPL